MTAEKNELKDENSALAAQIGQLQTELKSRVSGLQVDLNVVPAEYQNQDQGQIVSPSHLVAFCSNIQAYPEVDTEQVASRHISVVRKPHARYPTPADKWPSQVLEKQAELGK